MEARLLSLDSTWEKRGPLRARRLLSPVERVLKRGRGEGWVGEGVGEGQALEQEEDREMVVEVAKAQASGKENKLIQRILCGHCKLPKILHQV